MKQSCLGLGTSTKRTRRREFLDEMDRVTPWSDLAAETAPYLPVVKYGRPPFPVEPLMRIHFILHWFTLSDPVIEEALHDMPLFRDFGGLDGWDDRLPDESTILLFRYVREKRQLAERILATVNLLLGAKGLVHTVRGSAGHVNGVVLANSWLHGQETDVFANACHQGTHKRPAPQKDVKWHVAMLPGLRKLLDKVKGFKASIRAKVESPFRVIKRQFNHVKVAAWPRTQRNCKHCLRWPIRGWCASV